MRLYEAFELEFAGEKLTENWASAAPATAENYMAGSFATYRGRACGILRSGYILQNGIFEIP